MSGCLFYHLYRTEHSPVFLFSRLLHCYSEGDAAISGERTSFCEQVYCSSKRWGGGQEGGEGRGGGGRGQEGGMEGGGVEGLKSAWNTVCQEHKPALIRQSLAARIISRIQRIYCIKYEDNPHLYHSNLNRDSVTVFPTSIFFGSKDSNWAPNEQDNTGL